MAYFTGRDVRLWITTEHSDDGVRMDGTAQTNQLITYPDADAGSVDINAVITGLDAAGKASWQLSDITGVDVSVSAQDEDISFMGLRNVGKIEVKKRYFSKYYKEKVRREICDVIPRQNQSIIRRKSW